MGHTLYKPRLSVVDEQDFVQNPIKLLNIVYMMEGIGLGSNLNNIAPTNLSKIVQLINVTLILR